MKYTGQYGPQPPKKETLEQRLLKVQTFLDRPETKKEERLRKLKFQMFYVKNEIDKKKLKEMYKKIENDSKTEVQKWLDGEF